MNTIKVVFIASILLLSCRNEPADKEKAFFVFEPDIRLFTMYAFLNAAGYDEGMEDTVHPIRSEMRAYMDSMLTSGYKRKINAFYDSIKEHRKLYGLYAWHLNRPPDFEFNGNKERNTLYHKFMGLDSMLSSFYILADIEKCWNKYKPTLYELNRQYLPIANRTKHQVIDYLRLDSGYFSKDINAHINFQVNPLTTYPDGWNIHDSSGVFWFLLGPETTQFHANENFQFALYQHTLYPVIRSIVNQHGSLNKKVQNLLDTLPYSQYKQFDKTERFITESCIRTLDKKLYQTHHRIPEAWFRSEISSEYSSGYVLTKYFSEMLPEYEKSGKSFQTWYPGMINNLDIIQERERWINYWSNSSIKKRIRHLIQSYRQVP